MRDAVGLLGRLDKELANLADVIPLRVVGFGSHQLCRIQHAAPRFPRASLKSKKPASRKISAAGAIPTCYTALAADEPLLHADKPRTCLESYPQNPSCRSQFRCAATVSRLGFLGRVHRKNNSDRSDKPLAPVCQEKNDT